MQNRLSELEKADSVPGSLTKSKSHGGKKKREESLN